jgi:hypothetical protein
VSSLTSRSAKLTLINQLKNRNICREEAEELRVLGAGVVAHALVLAGDGPTPEENPLVGDTVVPALPMGMISGLDMREALQIAQLHGLHDRGLQIVFAR